jgi:hypothetical protein
MTCALNRLISSSKKAGMLRVLSLFVATIFVSGCIVEKQSAFSGERPRVHHVPAEQPDKAILCFFRPANDFGALRTYSVYEGNALIAKIRNGTCCFVYLSSGEHVLTMRILGIPDANCQIRVIGGHQYYILSQLPPLPLPLEPVFQVIEPTFGKSRIQTLRQKEPLSLF